MWLGGGFGQLGDLGRGGLGEREREDVGLKRGQERVYVCLICDFPRTEPCRLGLVGEVGMEMAQCEGYGRVWSGMDGSERCLGGGACR